MLAIATMGALIEVTPWDEIQVALDAENSWVFIDDRTPFQFKVEGELVDGEFFFGLYGPVVAGPVRYQNLTCNIMLRVDDSDWHQSRECRANFKVGPSVVKRVPNYDAAIHDGLPFYLHPEGTVVEGYPRISRFGGIRASDG